MTGYDQAAFPSTKCVTLTAMTGYIVLSTKCVTFTAMTWLRSSCFSINELRNPYSNDGLRCFTNELRNPYSNDGLHCFNNELRNPYSNDGLRCFSNVLRNLYSNDGYDRIAFSSCYIAHKLFENAKCFHK